MSDLTTSEYELLSEWGETDDQYDLFVRMVRAYLWTETVKRHYAAEAKELRAQVEALNAVTVGAIPETTNYANGWNDCRKAYRVAQSRQRSRIRSAELHRDFQALQRVLVGDTGQSAIKVASDLRARAEAAEAENERLRATLDDLIYEVDTPEAPRWLDLAPYRTALAQTKEQDE